MIKIEKTYVIYGTPEELVHLKPYSDEYYVDTDDNSYVKLDSRGMRYFLKDASDIATIVGLLEAYEI